MVPVLSTATGPARRFRGQAESAGRRKPGRGGEREPENARRYFKFRPTRLRLAADPELSIHRAYGVPKPEPTPELTEALETIRVNPFGDLPEPLPISEAAKILGGWTAMPEHRPTRAMWSGNGRS